MLVYFAIGKPMGFTFFSLFISLISLLILILVERACPIGVMER